MTFWDGIFKDEKDRIDFLQSYGSYDGERWKRMPLIASLMLTYKCNLKCVYCPFQTYFDNATERPSREWEILLEQLAIWGVRRVSFSGGEPLLYPSLDYLIRKATKLGIVTGVVTNGTRLTEIKLDMFVDAGLNALTVSIDTVDDALYSKLCAAGSGMLSKVLAMVVIARRRGSYWTGINTVITKMNVKAIGQVIEFFSRHEIPIQFQIFNPHRGAEDLLPEADDMRKAIDLIKGYKRNGASVINGDDYLEACCEFALTRQFPKSMECMVPFAEVVVTPNLMLKACCTSNEMGNASAPEWDKEWRNTEANRWRRMAKNKLCRDCFLIYHEPLGMIKQ